jgi:hypothetical protein
MPSDNIKGALAGKFAQSVQFLIESQTHTHANRLAQQPPA